ncbi:odorant receptor 42b-like [Calliphora vicina]|uniref:odorant receptor 42b-like n=1 Tax=Calliphora vicina TaxID=7373 RepID=UPI00325C22DB
MATLKLDGPQPKTKDCCVYLFQGLMIIGYLPPKENLVLFYIWTIFMNAFITVYMPIGFLLSFLIRSSSFSPSEFLTSLQISVNCFGCSLKMFVFLFLYRRLLASIKYMDQLDLRISEPEDKIEIRKIVAFSNRTNLMFTGLFLSYASSTFLTSVINGKPPYQLFNPFMDWTNRTLFFVIQAGVEYFMIDFHCYQQALMDTYPVIFITIIRTHLQILTRRINKLGQDSSLSSNERYEALVQCVIDHKNIMALYNKFSPVISGTMFVQFLIIGLILGITTIHIVLFADILAIFASMLYVASILAETFPCSFLANSLMDDSDNLSLAIFHSDWPSEEPRFKQMIAFFLLHTQKTLILTAMKIFPITMNSNINVVKFAFSVYTLMKQMDFGQNLKESVTGEKLP